MHMNMPESDIELGYCLNQLEADSGFDDDDYDDYDVDDDYDDDYDDDDYDDDGDDF